MSKPATVGKSLTMSEEKGIAVGALVPLTYKSSIRKGICK